MTRMPVDKAIEILSDAAYRGILTYGEDFKDALKVGIRAMVLLNRAKAGDVDEELLEALICPPSGRSPSRGVKK